MKLTDAGLETVLVFDEGMDLPHFAAFALVDSDEGRAAMRRYYTPFLELARDRGVPLVLSAPTWRASPDWGRLLGYEGDELAAVNRRAVAFLEGVRDEVLEPGARDGVVVEACVGPRSDAYHPTLLLDEAEAERYHTPQLRALAESGCTQVSAMTLTYPHEAIGITRAASAAGLEVVVSFTVETDGQLPNGTSIEYAIVAVDHATDGAAQSFMINLRASHALRRRVTRGRLARADPRAARQRLHPQPRRTRRGRGARLGRSRRPRRALRRPPRRPARARGRRRLLRDGHPPRDRDLRRVARGRPAGIAAWSVREGSAGPELDLGTKLFGRHPDHPLREPEQWPTEK